MVLYGKPDEIDPRETSSRYTISKEWMGYTVETKIVHITDVDCSIGSWVDEELMKEVGKWKTMATGETIKLVSFLFLMRVSDFDSDIKVFYVYHTKIWH